MNRNTAYAMNAAMNRFLLDGNELPKGNETLTVWGNEPCCGKSFANELRNELLHGNENENGFRNENESKNELEMNGGNELEMNRRNDVEMNIEKIVEMNRRTTTTVEQVIHLKKNCDYTNFFSSFWYGNGKYWIEGAFYKGNYPVYQFRINCKSEQDCRAKLNQIRRNYQ